MILKDRQKYLFATDIILLLYLIITALILIIQYNALPLAGNHLIVRGWILLLMAQVIFIHKYYSTPFMEFVHLLFPFLFLIYFYYEAVQLDVFQLSNIAEEHLSAWDVKLLGSSAFSILSSWNNYSTYVQFGYLIQLLAYASVPSLLFVAYSKNNMTGRKYAFISLNTFLIYTLILFLFPSNIYGFSIPHQGIFGGISELFQAVIDYNNVATLNILVGFLIISAMFFIYIDKFITLLLSLLWLLFSLVSISFNQQFLSGTLISWAIAPLLYYLSLQFYYFTNRYILGFQQKPHKAQSH